MKYIKLEVSRKQFSEIYVGVPDSWPDGKRLTDEQVLAAIEDTLSSSEWDDDPWDPCIEVESECFCDKETAKDSSWWDLAAGKEGPRRTEEETRARYPHMFGPPSKQP